MDDLKKRIAQLEDDDGDDDEQQTNTVDWIDATAIVGFRIEPALVGSRPGVGLSVIHDVPERFGDTNGGKVGEHETSGFCFISGFRPTPRSSWSSIAAR